MLALLVVIVLFMRRQTQPRTVDRTFRTRYIVNAAGLGADKVKNLREGGKKKKKKTKRKKENKTKQDDVDAAQSNAKKDRPNFVSCTAVRSAGCFGRGKPLRKKPIEPKRSDK